jgi:DNA-binding response OmpR family regulator
MKSIEYADRAGKILLVDGDVDSRDMLRFTLESDGHQVATANDGMEGLEVAREFRPDVAFVGIMRPGLDGHAVASAMRRDLGSGVWIIALTAVPERRSRSWGSGFNLHLREPAEPRTIKAIVGAALNWRVTARD